MGFTKLHSSILDSSIWSEPASTRIVWITMLAMAGADGTVNASILGLARRAVVTVEECEAAIATLCGPDRYSRDGTTGERIEPIHGGWRIINHEHYRWLRNEDDRREYQREWDRTHRGDRPNSKHRQPPTTPDNPRRQTTNPTKAEAEAEAEKDSAGEAPASAPTRTAKPVRSKPKPAGDSLRWSPETGWTGITGEDRGKWATAYPAVNLDADMAAAEQWLLSHPDKARKKQWRRFLTGWFNRTQERGGRSERNGRHPEPPKRIRCEIDPEIVAKYPPGSRGEI